MASNYERNLFNDYQKTVQAMEELSKDLKKIKKTKNELTAIIKSQEVKIEELEKENQGLKLEIERLKIQLNKDSTNSGKPSSTNSPYKNITNNRAPTEKKQGARQGHKAHFFDKEDISELIKEEKVEHRIIEVGEKAEYKEYKVRYVIDIEIKKIVTEYRYYADTNGVFNIPEAQNSEVTYGSNVKSICNLLYSRANASFDGITSFINDITDNVLTISKGSLVNWLKELNTYLNPEYDNIREKLLNSLFLHVDESPIKINTETYYLHSVSNGTHTLQLIHKNKSKVAIEELNFLNKYKGILIHDHYTAYYSYGIGHGECNVHILRYLNGVSDFTDHEWSKEMKTLLLDMKKRKEVLLELNIDAIGEKEFNDYKEKYMNILKKGKEELGLKDDNAYFDTERALINRLIEYADNHLLFLKNFMIPFSNNRAEADIRPAKRRQNIGIFRAESGAHTYVGIQSCISTYLKNGVNIFEAFKNALEGRVIIV